MHIRQGVNCKLLKKRKIWKKIEKWKGKKKRKGKRKKEIFSKVRQEECTTSVLQRERK